MALFSASSLCNCRVADADTVEWRSESADQELFQRHSLEGATFRNSNCDDILNTTCLQILYHRSMIPVVGKIVAQTRSIVAPQEAFPT